MPLVKVPKTGRVVAGALALLLVVAIFAASGVSVLVHRWDRPDALLIYLVRKIVHVILYGLLGGLLAIATGGRVVGTMLVSTLVGVSDELYQLAVPPRSARMWDVGLDVFGAGLGLWGAAHLIRVESVSSVFRTRTLTKKGGG